MMTIKFAEEVAATSTEWALRLTICTLKSSMIERTEIINALRLGHIDVIVGINL